MVIFQQFIFTFITNLKARIETHAMVSLASKMDAYTKIFSNVNIKLRINLGVFCYYETFELELLEQTGILNHLV